MPSCYQSKIINAPIDKVWKTIRCFHNLEWAPSVITSCQKVGTLKGDEVGAQRVLNEVFEETLVKIDEKDYTFSYSIDEGVSPVSSEDVSAYVGVVTLKEITKTDETLIEWKSSWESKTEDAESFCHTLYVQMMEDLNTYLCKETTSKKTTLFVHSTIDPNEKESLERYVTNASKILKAHNGKLVKKYEIARSITEEIIPQYLMIMEFEDSSIIEALASGPEYQRLIPFRDKAFQNINISFAI